MNLHLSPDEKFIDFVINGVERLNDSEVNEYYIYTNDNSDLKYVKSKSIKRLVIESEAWLEFMNIGILKYERVFIHYFDDRLYSSIARLPKYIKVIWCFFGHDGFSLFPETRYLQSETKKYFLHRRWTESVATKGALFIFGYPIVWLRRLSIFRKRSEKKKIAFRRVDYFGHFIYSDFEMIRRESSATFEYIPFTFNSFEELMPDHADLEPGPNILIGNSATFTNNHFEAMEALSTVKGLNKIFCPLSYGDRVYGEAVEQRGNELFGDKFNAMKNYLPLEEYKRIIRSCGVVFMNQDRSQASDNILISLNSGAKIFMSNKSSLYQMLKELGVKIFSIQDDINEDLLSPLPLSVRVSNKKLMEDFFGMRAHEERLLKILSL